MAVCYTERTRRHTEDVRIAKMKPGERKDKAMSAAIAKRNKAELDAQRAADKANKEAAKRANLEEATFNVDEFAEKWHISNSISSLIELHTYQSIAAPLGVAPRSKNHTTLRSEMQAHQWVNFTKVYGSVIIAQCYPTIEGTQNAVTGLQANMLSDVVSLCLESTISVDHHIKLATAVKRFAEEVVDAFPVTEWSLVLHLLMYHMPATIARWGPARGYWCFPFERSVYYTLQYYILYYTMFIYYSIIYYAIQI